MTGEEEKVLLASWLQGEHLEDIELINLKDFLKKPIVDELVKGNTVNQIARNLQIPLYELLSIHQFYNNFFYEQTIRQVINERLTEEFIEVESEVVRKGFNSNSISKLQSIIDTYNNGFSTIESDKELAKAFCNDYNERLNADKVQWANLPTLNKLTNGIKTKELTIIAGRTSTGKSAFGLQAIMGTIKANKKTLLFPLEMSNANMFDRMLAYDSIASSKDLKNGTLSGETLGKCLDYVDGIEKSGLLKIYEGKGNLKDIFEAAAKEKPFMIVIDQLTQIRCNQRFNSIRERYSYITSNLKSLAMRENVAVILLCQLNREAQNSIPSLANLKESGSIEEDADNVILLHRFNEDDISTDLNLDWNTEKAMRIDLAKQRSGETKYFNAIFKADKYKFYENIGY